MKISIALCILIQIFMKNVSFAQSEYLAEIHPETSSFSLFFPPIIEGINWVYVAISATDDLNNRFYFMRSSGLDSLCGYDLDDMSISTHVPCNDFLGLTSVRSIHFNPTSQTLDGMHFSQAEQRFFIGSVDISTGNTTQVGEFFEADYVHYVNTDAISALSNELYVLKYESGNTLFARYDLNDGNLIGEVQLDQPTSAGVRGFVVDQNSQTVYGVFDNWNDNLSYVCTINPDNGSISLIGSGFPLAYVPFQTHSIDEENHIYYMQGGANEYGYVYTGISLISGEIVSGSQLLPSGQMLEDIENLVNGRYMNSIDKLICLHWGDDFVGIDDFHSSDMIADVFRSLDSEEYTFNAKADIESADFQLVDLSGKICSAFSKTFLKKGESFSVQLPAPSGVYLLQMTSNQKGRLVWRLLNY